MIRLIGPLLAVTTLFATNASAAPVPATSCDSFLKRTCSSAEQTAFDRAAKKPVAAHARNRTADCGSFLKRSCSQQEDAHFVKGATRSARSTPRVAGSCDAFLQRSCSAQERLHFAKGTPTRLSVAAK